MFRLVEYLIENAKKKKKKMESEKKEINLKLVDYFYIFL